MKTIRFFIVAIAFISLLVTTFGQQKYAVLITGDYAVTSNTVPLSDQWNGGLGRSNYGFDEFWYDTYLMWEMLVYEKGYSNENVFVLFADGVDFSIDNSSWMWERYNAQISHPENFPITDYSANISNVEDVFTGLATGTGGFPQVTEDDFLFVWTFDHGGYIGGNSLIYLIDGEMTDDQFAALANPITANKKVYWMSQCHSGGFVDELEENNVVFVSACQDYQLGARADDKPYTENEIVNDNTYNHGEFNFHIYSSTTGSSPDYSNFYGYEHFFADSDLNSDNIITISESYIWETEHESTYEIPLYSDPGNIGICTSLQFPTLLHTDVTSNINYRGLIGISKNIHVLSGKELTFGNNSDIYFLNTANLIVDAGATLLLEGNVKINGNVSNKIIISGNLQIIGQNVKFDNSEIEVTSNGTLNINSGESIQLLSGSDIIVNSLGNLNIGSNSTILGTGSNQIKIDGNIQIGQLVNFDQISMFLNNQISTIIFDNVSFNHGQLVNYCRALNIESSNLSYSYLGSHRGYINLENSTFDKVWTYFTNSVSPLSNFSLSITNCIFSNGNYAGINMEFYDRYDIENNQIFNCNNGGISIYNAGRGPSGNQNIVFNDIYNNYTAGISLYNTTASIAGNNIHNNQFGVKLFNNSRVALFGNPTTYDEMNLIKDNTSYEFYASGLNFPWYFRYNAIIDEDNLGNPDDPLVFHQVSLGDPIPKDIRYNCWGNNFNYGQDLYPDIFLVNPTWCPGCDILNIPNASEELHTDAIFQFEAGNFADAKNLYELLIQQYPESEYAQSAMKELLRLESLVNGDYNSLKQFYRTNDTIVADTALTRLGDFLANQCDIILENWPNAINWYEAKIINPECDEDSIFAIIDLGYVYFLMENLGTKSSYIGTLEQFKPETKEQFIESRDYLLSLLPCTKTKEKNSQSLVRFGIGKLLQNVPNPCSDRTQIEFKLFRQAYINISIRDIAGNEIKFVDIGRMDTGTFQYDLIMNDMASGTYFYSLIIDGYITDTKKMSIIR